MHEEFEMWESFNPAPRWFPYVLTSDVRSFARRARRKLKHYRSVGFTWDLKRALDEADNYRSVEVNERDVAYVLSEMEPIFTENALKVVDLKLEFVRKERRDSPWPHDVLRATFSVERATANAS